MGGQLNFDISHNPIEMASRPYNSAALPRSLTNHPYN